MTEDGSRETGVYRRTVLKTTAAIGALAGAASTPAAAGTYDQSKTKTFSGDGATLTYDFTNLPEPKSQPTLTVDFAGDYEDVDTNETATVTADGDQVIFTNGFPSSSGNCVTGTESTSLASTKVSDGSLQVVVDNGSGVGASVCSTNEVTVTLTYDTNDAPVADAGGPYTVEEGGSVGLDGTGSSDSDGTIQAYRWDLDGDGRTEVDDATPVFDASGIDGPDTRTVTLTVKDDNGATDTDSATVDVENATPSVTIDSFPDSADEGDTVTLDASYSDGGGVDTHSATVDWGDGTSESVSPDQGADSLSATHTYADNGNYTATVTVVDDEGASDSASGAITVGNVAPSVTVTDVTGSIDEGGEASVTAEFSDPGSGDTHSATVDWGDGTTQSGNVDQQNDRVTSTHTYAEDGTYTVAVTVTDDDSGAGEDTAEVTVSNVAPTVTIDSLPGSAQEGETVTLSASFSDPGSADTHSATVDWGDGTTTAPAVNQTEDTLSATHTYADDGNYTVTVTVTDDDGGSDAATGEVAVGNVPPSVSIDSLPDSADEGETVSLSASFSDQGSGDTHTATVEWGDGTTDSPAVNQTDDTLSATHTYADDGNYTITVTVTDDESASGSASDAVAVGNVRPSVTITDVTGSLDEGGEASVTAEFSDPGSGDTHTATVDWGDGTTTSPAVNQTEDTLSATHTYADDGTYTVAVTVTDDDSGAGEDTAEVTVSNVAPTVTIDSLPGSAQEGETVTLSASFSDPGSADTHSATVEWGDGTTDSPTVDQAGNAFSASHTYADDGTYTVTAIVTDDDGGSDAATGEVAVGNADPSVSIDSLPDSADEGETVSLSASFSDPGSADTHTAMVEWGDGETDAPTVDQAADSLSATHTYADDGTYTVTVRVTDDDGGAGEASDAVTVGNVDPSVTITDVTGSLDEGGQASVAAEFSDPGTADTHSATVDWGDGTTESAAVDQTEDRASATHTYAEDGTYTVTVTVTDDDRGAGEDTAEVTVSNVAPSVTVTDYTESVDEDGQASLTASFTDPGTRDTHTATVDWGDGTTDSPTVDQAAHTLSATHTYDADAAYSVSVGVSDDDGATGTATVGVNSGIPGLSIDAAPAGSERLDLTVTAGTELSTLVVDVTDAQGERAGIPDLSEFTAEGSGTYATTLPVEGDGRYTARIRRAITTDGIEGGTPSDVARLETGPPGPSLFADQAGTDQAVRVGVSADEPLASTRVSLRDETGSEVTAITTEDLGRGESVDATVPVPEDGTYVAHLVRAEDRAGNDGASGQTDEAVVDSVRPEVNFWLTSPDGEDRLTAKVRSDEPLADLQVRIYHAAESSEPAFDVILPAFDRYRENDHVFYTFDVERVEPGHYDGVLLEAADAAGNGIVAKQTDDATVAEPDPDEPDTEPPEIDRFAATASDDTVEVTVATEEPLSTLRVAAVAPGEGEQLATIDTGAFTEGSADEDGRRYRATQTFDYDGRLRLELEAAADRAGNDAAADQSTTVTLPEDPVDRADEDDDGEVETPELEDAIADWARGEYTTDELTAIIKAWATGN